jgi:hypothetical protein
MVALLNIDPKQFGANATRHLPEFGRDPVRSSDRHWLMDYILQTYTAPHQIREGTFAGLGPVWFFAKGSDVVITDRKHNFLTILKNGTRHQSFQIAQVLLEHP